jgi:zinc protease
MLRKDAPLVISLLAEQLRMPAFAASEFSKAKKQFIAEAKQVMESTDDQAAIAFSQAIFPAGHPARQWNIEETAAAASKAKLEDLRAFHAANYGPAGLRLAFAGDLDPAELKTEIAKAFGGWKGGKPVPGFAPVQPAKVEKTVKMPDKSSVSVVIGAPDGIRANDPDWLPLQVANGVLGRGFTSRLVGNVRDREGLTYGIGTSLAGDSFREGAWIVKATFAPALLDRGIESTMREVQSWWRDGITADELAYRKSAAVGLFTVSLETTHGLAEQLLRCAERGFDVAWLDDFPAKTRALTVEQVNSAVKKHLDPEKMSTVKAGTLK